jgi:tetratricopeptide (TPR) repeat protein
VVALKRGQALLALRRADEAYREFTRTTELDPSCAEGFYGRAEVWRLRGDPHGVRRNLEAALQVAPRRWPRRKAVQAELRPR